VPTERHIAGNHGVTARSLVDQLVRSRGSFAIMRPITAANWERSRRSSSCSRPAPGPSGAAPLSARENPGTERAP